jgi:transposase
MEQRNGTALGTSPERSGGRDPNARPDAAPDPEVTARATRRRFTIEQKLSLLRQADACRQPGELGALLRREGLYSSHLAAWRKQRDRGLLAGEGVRRGPKSKRPDPAVLKLERENRKLRRALERAQLMLDLQKKVALILETPLLDESSDETES